MGLRASDEDRERTVDVLRIHQAAGRLTVDELEERSAAALAAVEVSDLAALTVDLPQPAATPVVQPPPVPRRRRPLVPGRYGFTVGWSEPLRPADMMEGLFESVVPAMTRYGYDVVERTPDRLVFEMSRTPGWVIIPCVLLFPVGLFALMIRTRDRVTVELFEGFRRTRCVVHGVAPLRVRQAFDQLED